MKSSLRLRLDQLSDRYEELNALLSDADVISDNQRFRNLSREHSELEQITQVWTAYRQAETDRETAEAMRADPEFRDMAEEEIQEAKERINALENQLNVLMIPKDPNDANSAFLEVRAGTGGDEAAIFSGDLFRMYERYAQT
ncbi:MAG: PCRF domain-containing protein, partial [Moraxellaceae bacterium]